MASLPPTLAFCGEVDSEQSMRSVKSVSGRTTMKDVADYANVSISTVSYVLNGNGPVSQARKKSVEQAIKALNYIPNESARGLKLQVSSTIGLVVPGLENQFFSVLARGVVQAASAKNRLVVFCSAETSEEAEYGIARLLSSKRVDGVIYESDFQESRESLLELQSLGPVVLVDERIPGIDLPAVVADGRRGARDIATHMINLGHRKISCVTGPDGHWTAEQRLAGYREGLALGGVHPDTMEVIAGDYRMNSGYEAAKLLLLRPKSDRPTVLMCSNDLMAIGALEFCRAEGIVVPRDVSITGFDDIPIANLLTPRLTTASQPALDMGKEAADLLIKLIDGEIESSVRSPYPVDLVVRDSTAEPLS